MRIVVVGCNGFIGKSLISELKNRGIESLGLSKENYDLVDEKTTNKLKTVLKKGDRVVFTSAIAPSKSADDVIKSIKMAKTFCEATADIELDQVVLISSDSVYGDKSGLFNENSSCDPNSFHGLAQLSREIIFKNSKINNLAILRVCAVYGEGDTHNGYGPNRFINQIKNSESIKIFGKGLNHRDHIHIFDVTDLIIRTLLINLRGILNVVTGTSYSFEDVAQKCQSIFSPTSKIEYTGDEGEIILKNFDNTKICELFPDFKAKSLDVGLKLWKSQI